MWAKTVTAETLRKHLLFLCFHQFIVGSGFFVLFCFAFFFFPCCCGYYVIISVQALGISNHIFNFFYVLLLLLCLSVVLCLLLFVFWGSFSFYSVHEAPVFWSPDVKHQLIGKDPNTGED